MQTVFDLPTSLEGEWELRGHDGKVIASSSDHPTARLAVQPFFYEGQPQQTLTRLTTEGGKGRRVRQLLRMFAKTGKVQAIELDRPRKKVKAPFDTLEPLKKDTP